MYLFDVAKFIDIYFSSFFNCLVELPDGNLWNIEMFQQILLQFL